MIRLLLYFFIINFPLEASTILFVGDSHSVGPFGWYLDQHLRDHGHQVETYASCGSVPKWWMTGQPTSCGYFARNAAGVKTQLTHHPTPLLSKLLTYVRPEVVIMEFGGNYAKVPDDEFVKKDIKSFVHMIKQSGAQCFWITNPDTRANRHHLPRIVSLIKEAVADNCPIFESHLVTQYPATGGDGIHYWFTQGLPVARHWADQAFADFKQYWSREN
jgi:hypothetical protein